MGKKDFKELCESMWRDVDSEKQELDERDARELQEHNETHNFREHIREMKCPKCGNTDVTLMRYVESIECFRNCLGILEGHLVVHQLYTSGEGYDDGHDSHFECHAQPDDKWCGHRWPVPDWLYPHIYWK